MALGRRSFLARSGLAAAGVMNTPDEVETTLREIRGLTS
jgi:hypothetical protein